MVRIGIPGRPIRISELNRHVQGLYLQDGCPLRALLAFLFENTQIAPSFECGTLL